MAINVNVISAMLFGAISGSPLPAASGHRDTGQRKWQRDGLSQRVQCCCKYKFSQTTGTFDSP